MLVPLNIALYSGTATDTHLIQTPLYNGQFFCPDTEKSHVFSLNITRLIRIPG